MTCKFPLCKLPAVGEYCTNHAKIYGKKPPNKRAQKDREYRKIVREMLSENPFCEMRTPVCTNLAQGLHHMKKRGDNYLNKEYLKRSCNPCNLYVEEHPLYALEKGLSLRRHSK